VVRSKLLGKVVSLSAGLAPWSARLAVLVGIPYRLWAGFQPIWIGFPTVANGVHALPIIEVVAAPVEVFAKIVGCFGDPEADHEP
jgi:hypothetical protein